MVLRFCNWAFRRVTKGTDSNVTRILLHLEPYPFVTETFSNTLGALLHPLEILNKEQIIKLLTRKFLTSKEETISLSCDESSSFLKHTGIHLKNIYFFFFFLLIFLFIFVLIYIFIYRPLNWVYYLIWDVLIFPFVIPFVIPFAIPIVIPSKKEIRYELKGYTL